MLVSKETEAERRLRIGKQALSNVDRFFSKKSFDAKEEDSDGRETQVDDEKKPASRPKVRIVSDLDAEVADDIFFADSSDVKAQKLKQQVLERKGRVTRLYSDQISSVRDEDVVFRRGHERSVTQVALRPDSEKAYSVGKDGFLIEWDMERMYGNSSSTAKRVVSSGFGILNAVAVCPTEPNLVAVAGSSGVIKIVDTRVPSSNSDSITPLSGHRGPVHALGFRMHSADLYSGGADRTIKVWNVSNRAYMQTLYGHAGTVHSLDVLQAERCVSVSNDGSVRLWRLEDETQLEFDLPSVVHGDSPVIVGSMDSVAFVNETRFVSASQGSVLYLWSAAKRKPLDTLTALHPSLSDPSGSRSWISSLACCRGSDLIATGAADGFLRFHRVDLQKDKLAASVHALALPGWINGLAFSHDSRFLVAALGQEHRLGRWTVVRDAKAGVACVPLFREGAEDR